MLTNHLLNYTTTNQESQVKKIKSRFPPISLPQINEHPPQPNLLSHAPNRCEGSADTIVDKKQIQYTRGDCGKKYIIFKCSLCGSRVVVLYRCHHRLCPYCAWVRSMKWFHKLENINFRYPLFLTLTLRSGDNLKELISKAIKGFQAFKRHFKFKKGLYSVEICKRNNRDGNGKWYVHIHVLLDHIWLNGEEASAYWFELTGAYVKKIKRVYKRKESILEVCKYVTKGLLDLEKGDLEEVDQAIKGRRLINTFGIPRSEFSLLDTIETSLPKKCECGGRFRYEGVLCVTSVAEFKILKAFCNVVELKEYYDTS